MVFIIHCNAAILCCYQDRCPVSPHHPPPTLHSSLIRLPPKSDKWNPKNKSCLLILQVAGVRIPPLSGLCAALPGLCDAVTPRSHVLRRPAPALAPPPQTHSARSSLGQTLGQTPDQGALTWTLRLTKDSAEHWYRRPLRSSHPRTFYAEKESRLFTATNKCCAEGLKTMDVKIKAKQAIYRKARAHLLFPSLGAHKKV